MKKVETYFQSVVQVSQDRASLLKVNKVVAIALGILLGIAGAVFMAYGGGVITGACLAVAGGLSLVLALYAHRKMKVQQGVSAQYAKLKGDAQQMAYLVSQEAQEGAKRTHFERSCQWFASLGIDEGEHYLGLLAQHVKSDENLLSQMLPEATSSPDNEPQEFSQALKNKDVDALAKYPLLLANRVVTGCAFNLRHTCFIRFTREEARLYQDRLTHYATVQGVEVRDYLPTVENLIPELVKQDVEAIQGFFERSASSPVILELWEVAMKHRYQQGIPKSDEPILFAFAKADGKYSEGMTAQQVYEQLASFDPQAS